MVTTTTGLATSFITFTRTSNATVTDSNGFIKWAGHNLLTNSESFGASGWFKYLATVSENTAVSPFGTTTADRLVEAVGTDAHLTSQDVSIAAANASVSYTFSCFLKKAERSFAMLYHTQSAKGIGFNLTTGVTTTPSGIAAPTNSSIVSVGNDWWLCSITITASTGTNTFGIYTMSDATTFSYAGNTSNGILLWGAHLYRSDLGGMVLNPARGDAYYPTTPRNLLGFTEDFSNAAWTKSGLAATPVLTNVLNGPNGLPTADKMVENSSASTHILFATVTVADGPKTFSVYAKAAERSWVFLRAGANIGAYFNLSAGSVGTADAGVTASIVSAGDGWYRCAITLNIAAGLTYPTIFISTGNGTTSYTGDGTSGIYLWGAQLSDSASLDAYSPVYGAAVTSAAYYAPRLDYDPVTLAARGLLVEELRSNILLNSATLSTQSVTVSAAAYTLSFWGTGSVTLSGTSTAGPLVGTGANNRVTLTFTPTAGTLTLTVSGTVTQAQLEAGSFPTSYIPTGAASATRSADVASVATSAFPYSATEGSLVASFTPINVAAARRAVQLDDGTTNERITLGINSTPNGLMTVNDGGVSQASIATGTPAANTTMKLAARYKVNDFAVSANGAAVSTDTSGTLPTVDTLRLGSGTSSTEPLNGWLRQVTYLPRALTNAELQSRAA